MKVYLAGKIAANDWRHQLVPTLRWQFSDQDYLTFAESWPQTPMYRKDFHYVGPYFLSCDHGCAHGENNHGAGATSSGCIVDLPFRPHLQESSVHQDIAIRCYRAIKDCDTFFAWLNEPCTAYGTLVELGIAAALNKTIVIGSANVYGDGDLWFAYEHADYVAIQPTAEAAFRQWEEHKHPVDEQRQKCESPLELAFWDAYLCRKPPSLKGLIAQHPVSAGGRNYRLDFAIPERKIAFEMDGYTYHGKDRAHFNNDRRRDLDLKLAGWQVHRFDGDHVRDDTPNVIEIAAELAADA